MIAMTLTEILRLISEAVCRLHGEVAELCVTAWEIKLPNFKLIKITTVHSLR